MESSSTHWTYPSLHTLLGCLSPSLPSMCTNTLHTSWRPLAPPNTHIHTHTHTPTHSYIHCPIEILRHVRTCTHIDTHTVQSQTRRHPHTHTHSDYHPHVHIHTHTQDTCVHIPESHAHASACTPNRYANTITSTHTAPFSLTEHTLAPTLANQGAGLGPSGSTQEWALGLQRRLKAQHSSHPLTLTKFTVANGHHTPM